MTPTPFDIALASADRLVVRLRGTLEHETALQLEKELGLRAGTLTAQACVLFDLSAFDECVLSARTVLVRLQKSLAPRVRRTAFLADSPKARGLALWVMHLADDPHAKAVATMAQAEAWFAHAAGRVEDAENRMSTALRGLSAARGRS